MIRSQPWFLTTYNMSQQGTFATHPGGSSLQTANKRKERNPRLLCRKLSLYHAVVCRFHGNKTFLFAFVIFDRCWRSWPGPLSVTRPPFISTRLGQELHCRQFQCYHPCSVPHNRQVQQQHSSTAATITCLCRTPLFPRPSPVRAF